MGMLIDGKWQDIGYDTASSDGRFVRDESKFRNWITQNKNAEPGRYHIYASYACPWAHRVLIYRALKDLEKQIDVSFVHWLMAENGWTFEKDEAGIVGDKLFGSQFLHQIYTKADVKYSGRVTVPILWDKKNQTIVSNESSDIIRMFNSAFNNNGALPGDYYPENLQADIDVLNKKIYKTVNNGVYKAGFATSQAAYDEAVTLLFDGLDFLDERLSQQRFLLGNKPLEADWRLFPTLFRFDAIYVGHFKCSKKRIMDYSNLWAYARDLYQWPGIANTTNMLHAKRHYYTSHVTINPNRIVPIDQVIDWNRPHGRENLFNS